MKFSTSFRFDGLTLNQDRVERKENDRNYICKPGKQFQIGEIEGEMEMEMTVEEFIELKKLNADLCKDIISLLKEGFKEYLSLKKDKYVNSKSTDPCLKAGA